MSFQNTLEFAKELDAKDPLRGFREQFHFPELEGKAALYFCGNSLGLQPKNTRRYLLDELDDWAKFGVEGHLQGRTPWYSYHETLTQSTARLVGAKPSEVVVMNSLTVNLHLMLVSFYRPDKKRNKILIEASAFPSDQYAVASHAKLHGLAPESAVVEATPRAGEKTLRTEDVVAKIEELGDSLSLVLFGGVNYLSGQAFDFKAITRAAHRAGAKVGFDLAHAAGNLALSLHDDGCDFAVWCSYKYLNAGPGGIAGCFVHERHGASRDLPRFEGWWGHNKVTRFKMDSQFDPIEGAEGWQLSNPPIFQLAALRASMELFDKASISSLREKSEKLTAYLEFLLDGFPKGLCSIITPRDKSARGCQLSLELAAGKELSRKLLAKGVICDFREPNIVRVAPTPLYNSFEDVYLFAGILKEALVTT